MIFNNKLLVLSIFLSYTYKVVTFTHYYRIDMSTPAQRRLIKDLMRLQQQDSDFMCCPINDNLLLWTATFQGSQNTIWEGGLFTLRLIFTQRYPNAPPRVKFLNKMFHPNIYNDGRICLDMLYNQWSPIYDVWAVLTAIKTLLSDPNPQSPANSEASNIFRDNKIQYEYKVKQIVQQSLQFQESHEQIIKQAEKQLKQKEAEQAKVEKQLKLRQEVQQRFDLNKNLTNKKPLSNKLRIEAFQTPRKIYNLNILPITAPKSSFNRQDQYSNQQFDGSQDDDDSESFGSQSDKESNIKSSQPNDQVIQNFEKLQKEIQRVNRHQSLLGKNNLLETSTDKKLQGEKTNHDIKQEEETKKTKDEGKEEMKLVISITGLRENKIGNNQQKKKRFEGKYQFQEEEEIEQQERFELNQQSCKSQGQSNSEEQSDQQIQEPSDQQDKQ